MCLKSCSLLSPIGLGTAGLVRPRYGVPHEATRETALETLIAARMGGWNYVDTAPSYDSESVVGEFLRLCPHALHVLTKVKPGSFGQMLMSALRSRMRVGTKITCLQLHNAGLDDMERDYRWFIFLLRMLGIASRLGATVYTWNEANAAMAHPDIWSAQIPYNIAVGSEQMEMSMRLWRELTDTKIILRSVFLRGALAGLFPEQLRGHVPHAVIDAIYDKHGNNYGTLRRDAFDYALGCDAADSMVIGAGHRDEVLWAVEHKMKYNDRPEPLPIDPALTDPRRWPEMIVKEEFCK